MNYPIEKYHYYTYRRADGATVVKAVSTYAGKRVTGKAICHPHDNFDFETGKALAAARCNEKVALKRQIRAKQKVEAAYMAMVDAECYYDKMIGYLADANAAVDDSSQILTSLYETL